MYYISDGAYWRITDARSLTRAKRLASKAYCSNVGNKLEVATFENGQYRVIARKYGHDKWQDINS